MRFFEAACVQKKREREKERSADADFRFCPRERVFERLEKFHRVFIGAPEYSIWSFRRNSLSFR